MEAFAVEIPLFATIAIALVAAAMIVIPAYNMIKRRKDKKK